MLVLSDIRRLWVDIKPQLEYVKDIRGGAWRPEDIYAACVNGQAELWTAPEGFVVLKPMMDNYSLEPFLLVWLAYGEGHDCIDTYQDQIIHIARMNGFPKLQFWRRARGQQRESKGWHKEYTIYELEIS